MRHTIVIELPDYANPDMAEQRITDAIQRISWSREGKPGFLVNDFAAVIEYHYEQMTTTEENP